MKVVIRADASTSMGTGHLMRCLAIAQALRDAGDEVILVSCAAHDDRLFDHWIREGVDIRSIAGPAGQLGDARATGEIVRSERSSWLIVDGYHFVREYGSLAAGSAMLAWIDDHGTPSPSADLVVNGNLYAGEALYPGTSARLAVGARYALLRREFRSAQGSISRSGIVLSMGGADPDGRTGSLMTALEAHRVRGRVVVGPAQRRRKEVRDIAAALGWEVLDAPADMAAVLGDCRLAVVGAGTTTLEALALGTPMVAVRIADNQRLLADELERRGLASVADGSDAEAVAAEAAALLYDDERRALMTRRAEGVVDGRGAVRVVGQMRESLLVLRAATTGDARMLHTWRNDPATRCASFHTDEISYDEHVRWLTASLRSDSRALLVGELDERPVGVIRLDLDGREAIVSVTLAPDSRGVGLAAPLLRRALQRAGELGVLRVTARIRPENLFSRRAFAAAGFHESPRESSSDVLTMVASLHGPR